MDLEVREYLERVVPDLYSVPILQEIARLRERVAKAERVLTAALYERDNWEHSHKAVVAERDEAQAEVEQLKDRVDEAYIEVERLMREAEWACVELNDDCCCSGCLEASKHYASPDGEGGDE